MTKGEERAEDARLARAWADAMQALTVAEDQTIGLRRQLVAGDLQGMEQEARARLERAIPLFETTEKTARDQVDRIEEQQRARRESKNIRVLQTSVRVTLLAAIASLVAASPQLVDGVLKLLWWSGRLK